LYDYATYDEYGPLPSKAPTAYDEEVGPGVAAETDISESTVAGSQAAFGQKGEKGEPAVIEPVRSNMVFQDPLAFRDPRALLEILVTEVRLVALVFLVLMAYQDHQVPC
ncbi:hypothetical protein XENOCAPTIV_029696, partial [Xenoophorus captivus]